MALFYTTLCYVYSLSVCLVVLCKGVNEVQTGHTIQRLLLRYPAAGNRNNSTGAFTDMSSSGFYRSATTNGTESAYNLYGYSTGVYPRLNNNRAPGFAVRCVSVF